MSPALLVDILVALTPSNCSTLSHAHAIILFPYILSDLSSSDEARSRLLRVMPLGIVPLLSNEVVCIPPSPSAGAPSKPIRILSAAELANSDFFAGISSVGIMHPSGSLHPLPHSPTSPFSPPALHASFTSHLFLNVTLLQLPPLQLLHSFPTKKPRVRVT